MPLVLALECSSSPCSAALLAEGRPLARAAWDAGAARGARLFEAIRELLREAGVDPGDVDAFAAGTGPGAFTALRMACAAVSGLALPGGRPAVGVPSCAAAALALFETGVPPPLSLLGDARRGRLWHARFESAGGWPVARDAPGLVDAAGLGRVLEGSRAVAAAEWDRIAAAVEQARPDHVQVVRRNAPPDAAFVARLAIRALEGAGSPPAPIPIYLTAATLAAPRAPAPPA